MTESYEDFIRAKVKLAPSLGFDVEPDQIHPASRWAQGDHAITIRSSANRIMTDPIQATIKERTNHCGPFTGHAEITQQLKNVIRLHAMGKFVYVNGKRRPFLADDQEEALDMICHKIGRIINGDPNHVDSWHDIAGYAQLVADRLNGVQP